MKFQARINPGLSPNHLQVHAVSSVMISLQTQLFSKIMEIF